MKKIIFILLLAFLFSCNNKEETQVTNDKKVETQKIKEPAGPTVLLRYDFKKGDKFSYKLHTNSHNIEEIIADTTFKNEIKQNATYKFDFNVKEVDQFNVANIEVRINSITAETNFNGESIKYDSKLLYSTRERIQFVDYEAVKNEKFLISVNNIGQVVKVDKINRIMKNILDIQNVPDTLSAKTKEQMRMNIANGTLMPLTQQIFKVLAENKVGIDSLWQMKYTTPLAVFNVENTAVFKIIDMDFSKDTSATISSKILMNVSGNNVVSENGMTYTFSHPNINAEGTVKYNNTKGLVEEATSNTRLELSMYVEGVDANNKTIQSTKKDFSNNTNSVELL